MAEVATNNGSVSEPDGLSAVPLSRFRCAGCGYGASCRIAPERCPMCGSSTWSYETRQQQKADNDAPLGRDPFR